MDCFVSLLDTVACCPLLLLTCALLMASSHSEGQDERYGSASLSDSYINDIRREHHQGSEVGYRTTSITCGAACTYFHHEACHYCGRDQVQIGGTGQITCESRHDDYYNPCRRYKQTLNGADKWFQCQGHLDSDGGIDCFSKCGRWPVVSLHRRPLGAVDCCSRFC